MGAWYAGWRLLLRGELIGSGNPASHRLSVYIPADRITRPELRIFPISKAMIEVPEVLLDSRAPVRRHLLQSIPKYSY